ncbi:MAG: NIPSNAP family protein [Burkholderiales bacterium]
MLYDVRTYVCRPGTLKKHLALYEEFGWEAQRSHLGEPLAYLLTETGDVNSYTHIWVYDDAADRDRKRTALYQDAKWLAYVEKSGAAGYLLSQHNSLMVPAAFFAKS